MNENKAVRDRRPFVLIVKCHIITTFRTVPCQQMLFWKCFNVISRMYGHKEAELSTHLEHQK